MSKVPSITEWPLRRLVLSVALILLAEQGALTAKEIVERINRSWKRSISEDLVAGVLLSEGRRYIVYDKSQRTFALQKKISPSHIKLLKRNLLQASNDRQETTPLHVEKTCRQIEHEYEQPISAINSAFFNVGTRGSKLSIRLNKDHPIYPHLMAILSDSADDTRRARFVISSLIRAWAEYEEAEPMGKRKLRVQDAREDWGRVLYYLLEDDVDE